MNWRGGDVFYMKKEKVYSIIYGRCVKTVPRAEQKIKIKKRNTTKTGHSIDYLSADVKDRLGNGAFPRQCRCKSCLQCNYLFEAQIWSSVDIDSHFL